jgi:hypothetical protein
MSLSAGSDGYTKSGRKTKETFGDMSDIWLKQLFSLLSLFSLFLAVFGGF